MQRVFRVETTLAHQLAELYALVVDEFDAKSGVPLAELNRTLLQTGVLHHLTMMAGLGLLSPAAAERAARLMEQVGQDTIMWDVVKLARRYWQSCANGPPPEAPDGQ